MKEKFPQRKLNSFSRIKKIKDHREESALGKLRVKAQHERVRRGQARQPSRTDWAAIAKGDPGHVSTISFMPRLGEMDVGRSRVSQKQEMLQGLSVETVGTLGKSRANKF